MSLASELTQAGTPPGRLDVTCRIVMDEVESGDHEIVASYVDAVVSAGAVLARILVVDARDRERAVGLDRRAQRDLVAGAELR